MLFIHSGHLQSGEPARLKGHEVRRPLSKIRDRNDAVERLVKA